MGTQRWIVLVLVGAAAQVQAYNYDRVILASEHIMLLALDGATADPGSLRYLARFLRSAERLPEGVRIRLDCVEPALEVRADRSALPELVQRRLRRFDARMARFDERQPASFSRLRTCLAWAARMLGPSLVPPPAQSSAQWFAVQAEGDFDCSHTAFAEGLLRAADNGSRRDEPMGFFLRRRVAEAQALALRDQGTPARVVAMRDRTGARLNSVCPS